MKFFDDILKNNTFQEAKNEFSEYVDKIINPQKYQHFNVGYGRREEITKNLEEGLKNDKRARWAIENGDHRSYRMMYNHGQADPTKQWLIDDFFFQESNKYGEEKVRQYDGKIVPKSQARNQYGGLIHGQVLKESDDFIPVFTNKVENPSEPGFFKWVGNKIENSFDGADWDPFDDPKYVMKDTSFTEAMKKSAHDMGDAALYVFDKLGRLVRSPFMSSEDNAVFREKNQKYNKMRDEKVKNIMTTDWGQAENQDTGKWGVTKQTFRGLGGNINMFLADAAKNMGLRDLAELLDDNGDSYLIEKLRHEQENPDTFDEKLLAGGINLAAAMVYAGAGSALGGAGAFAGGTMFGASQEYGSMKQELLLNGVSNEEASNMANTYAVGAALLESAFPAGKIKKVLGPQGSQILKGSWRKASMEIGKDFLKEGGTEFAQEVWGNSIKQKYGIGDGFFDGGLDAFLLGGILGGVAGGVVNPESRAVFREMKRDITKALDIVSGKTEAQNNAEYQMAKIALEQYQNLVKMPGIQLKEGSDTVIVETVHYDDNKYSANARVETENENNSLQFGEIFETKNEAIKDSLNRSKLYIEEGTPLREAMESNIDDLISQYEQDIQRHYEEAMEQSDVLSEIQDMNNSDFLNNMKEEEYYKIMQKENPSNFERVLAQKYEQAMEEKINTAMEQEVQQAIKEEVMRDFEQYGKFQNVGESDMTIQDHQELAEAVYKTLWNPRSRFSLQLSPQSQKRMEMPSKLSKILLEKAEWTREKLLSSHQDFVSGLQALIDYNTKNGFPTKTGERFIELQKFLKNHDFDKADWDLFQTYLEKYADKELTPQRKNIGLGKHARVPSETQGVETNIGQNEGRRNESSTRGATENHRSNGRNEESTNEPTTELKAQAPQHQEPVSKTDISTGEKPIANKKEVKDQSQAERKSITKGSTTHLQDVGEKIGGARKDLYALLGKVDLDIAYTTTDIEKLPIAKVLPNPDWNTLIQNGTLKTEDALVLMSLRAKISTKPRDKWTKSQWADGVLAYRKELKNVLDGKMLSPVIRAFEKDNITLHTKLDTLNNPMYEKYLVKKSEIFRDGKTHSGYNIIRDGKRIGFFATLDEIIPIIQQKEQQTQKEKIETVQGEIKESKETFRNHILYSIQGDTIQFIYKKGSKEIPLTQETYGKSAYTYAREQIQNDTKIQEWQQIVADIQAIDEAIYKTESLEAIHSTTNRKEGENISAERFQKTFGLRGVEFGNWLNSRERQERVNQVYDAFMDLSHIIGIKPEGIGLNGELGFAFGSRGRKGAMAHYEKEKVVINLTKKDGYGSVAHEWWHAFDNYLKRVDSGSSYASDFATDTLYTKNPELGKHIQTLIKKLGELGIQQRSQNLDKLKGKKYYTLPTEMGARAFESWIEYKLQQEGRKNGMLVSLNPERSQDDPYNPYATGDELTKLDPLWQDLWNSKKETNNGKAVYYMSKKSTGIGGAEEINDKEIQKNPQEAEKKKSLGANDATPMTITDSIPENILKSNDFLVFGEDSIFYTKKSGERVEYKKPNNKRRRDWLRESFRTNQEFPLQPKNEQYVKILKNIQLGQQKSGIIGDTIVGQARIEDWIIDKIFRDHGPFSHKNFIATLNESDYFIEDRGGEKGVVNFLKKFDSDNFLLVAGTIDDNGLFVTSHFEHRNNFYKEIQKEIDNQGKVFVIGKDSERKRVTNVNKNYNSTGGNAGITGAEHQNTGEKTDFKLSERIKEVIRKLNTNYTRYVAKGSVGTFYGESGNIALRSINDIDVVHHELSHLIDTKGKVTDAYKDDTEVVTELEKIYMEYYPGANIDDTLDTKMREGYAVLQEKYLMLPSLIVEKYPLLVETFVENANLLQKELNADMQKIITDYQALSDIDKIGAVVADDKKNTEYNTFLNAKEKIEQQISDMIVPFVKLEEKAQGIYDVANLLYASKAINGRIFANIDNSSIDIFGSVKNKKIEKEHEFWHFNKKLELEKKYDYNWGSLIKEVGDAKKMDEFANWLIARDQVGQYERLGRMNAKLKKMEEGEGKEQLLARQKEVVAYLKANESILSKEMVHRVHNQYYEEFKEWAKKFDNLLSHDIEFQKNAGIISEDHYNAIKRSYGYAPMRRIEDDGIVGANNTPLQISGFKVPKMTQIKGRDGGSMEILNPLLGAMENHIEAMQKGYKQLTLNRLYDMMREYPQFSQVVEVVTTIVNGKPTYTTPTGKPLNMDENIITKMENGKPKAMALSGELIETLKSVFHPPKRGGVEKIFAGATNMFTKGTTGVYVPFFLTNLIRDQFTAVAHTKNGYIPVWSQMKEILPLLWKKKSKEAEYMREYLSLGGHQMRLKWSEAKGSEILEYLSEGQNKWQKTKRILVDTPLDILSAPSNFSEIGTRMAEYILARKNGKTMWEAMEDAGQLTAPFHHAGKIQENSFGRGYIKTMPFLNAILQGLSQYARTARTSVGRKQIGKVFVGTTAMIISSLLLLWEMADEEDKQALLDMEGSQFGQFIFLPKGGGEFYKIPLPQEVGFIGGMFGMMINEQHGAEYSAKEYLDTAMSWLPDQVKINEPDKMALSLVPVLIKPSIEVFFNKKSFPKVKDLESASQQRLPSEFRYHTGTSAFAKWAGSTEVAKTLGISPIKIDHLVTGHLGRASGYATGKDTAYNPLTALVQKNYFTNGRKVEKMKNEQEYIEQQLTAQKRGLLEMSDEQVIELQAKKRALEKIDDKLGEYFVLSRDNDKSQESREKRMEIWNDIDEYFKKGVIATDMDKLKYEKQKEKNEWKKEKEEIMKEAMKMWEEDKSFGRATKIQNTIKERMGGNKMTETQKRRFSQFQKDFFMERSYKNDIDMMEFYNANTNDEKKLSGKK